MSLEQLKKYRDLGLKDCPLCAHWFLGCLWGRKEWKDRAEKPNFRYVGLSGMEYSESDIIIESEYPCRMVCDVFEWDKQKERLGRVVY